jgi:hypothetical protein
METSSAMNYFAVVDRAFPFVNGSRFPSFPERKAKLEKHGAAARRSLGNGPLT